MHGLQLITEGSGKLASVPAGGAAPAASAGGGAAAGGAAAEEKKEEKVEEKVRPCSMRKDSDTDEANRRSLTTTWASVSSIRRCNAATRGGACSVLYLLQLAQSLNQWNSCTTAISFRGR